MTATSINATATVTPFDNYKFKPIREATVLTSFQDSACSQILVLIKAIQVARAMASRYFQDLHDYADTDVVIVGMIST